MAAAYYQPRITNTLYGNFGAREQVFYYGSNHSFDFGSLDVEAGLNYFLPQFHNLILRGEYDFNRLTLDDRLGDEFFLNHSLIFNAELPFRFGDAHPQPRTSVSNSTFCAWSVAITAAGDAGTASSCDPESVGRNIKNWTRAQSRESSANHRSETWAITL